MRLLIVSSSDADDVVVLPLLMVDCHGWLLLINWLFGNDEYD